MGHECDDCGETFETLSRLRLHDCGNDHSDGSLDASEVSGVSDTAGVNDSTSPSSGGGSGRSVAELDDSLDRVADGDVDAIHHAIAAFESTLSAALDEGGSGDAYREVFWSYYEPVADALDAATRSEGRDVLDDVMDAYDPAADDELPLVTPALANVVGRYVIRTRLADGVEAVPITSLEYLDAVAVDAADGDDIALEETHAYGWGIGHPDHSIVDRLRARATSGDLSVSPTLEHAFYADQYAAVDALERLVGDESIDGTFPRVNRDDMPYRRYLLDCVYDLKTDGSLPRTPRYYDWADEFDYSFELDEGVERRVRDLVEETGFDAELPDDWTLRDLGI
ncbi:MULTISPECIES: hypothetical protein [Haloferacaceae]|uniref:C2H2-type domain-containing protein n=1 Tax=Halorubrum glutamatedens TaxID=2707018 RepID=A0ABD5QMI0_9EURY|nr:hypothetical protein [Halobellus captivus]